MAKLMRGKLLPYKSEYKQSTKKGTCWYCGKPTRSRTTLDRKKICGRCSSTICKCALRRKN